MNILKDDIYGITLDIVSDDIWDSSYFDVRMGVRNFSQEIWNVVDTEVRVLIKYMINHS